MVYTSFSAVLLLLVKPIPLSGQFSLSEPTPQEFCLPGIFSFNLTNFLSNVVSLKLQSRLVIVTFESAVDQTSSVKESAD